MTEPATVTLIGPSTSGKSTLRGAIEQTLSDGVEIFDTDKELAKALVPTSRFSDGPHVFEIYVRSVEIYGDTDRANEQIGVCEETLLRKLLTNPPTKPRLVVTGPNVPGRASWAQFRKRYPTCVYLRKAADEVYKGLIDREQRTPQSYPEITRSRGFRSWNEDLTAELRAGNYEPLPPKDALAAVEKLLALQSVRFEAACPRIVADSREFVGYRTDEKQRAEMNRVVEEIIKLLQELG